MKFRHVSSYKCQSKNNKLFWNHYWTNLYGIYIFHECLCRLVSNTHWIFTIFLKPSVLPFWVLELRTMRRLENHLYIIPVKIRHSLQWFLFRFVLMFQPLDCDLPVYFRQYKNVYDCSCRVEWFIKIKILRETFWTPFQISDWNAVNEFFKRASSFKQFEI